MKLDVESLRALRLVAQTGSFTEAAAQLGMTQSAVSWKIKRLEERVGHDLVKRGSEPEPTPNGHDLLMYADRIIDAHDEAVEHLSRSDLAGVVRLGTNEDLRGGALAAVLARFGRMYPQVKLAVRVQLSGAVREWLDDGAVDLAVLQVPAADIRPDDIVLWQEPMTWVHGVDFDPGAAGSAEPVPVISFGPGLAYLDHSEESLTRAGFRWRMVLECPMLSGVQAAVEAGLGIAALNARNTTARMTEWGDAKKARLPHLAEVIRTGEGGDSEVLAALRDALSAALIE